MKREPSVLLPLNFENPDDIEIDSVSDSVKSSSS